VRVHFDVLGWLHSLWGVFGVLAGAALGIIALGAVLSVGELGDATGPLVPSVILLLLAGGLLAAGGLVMIAVGGALRQRRPAGRLAALVLSIPNLLVVPFGTALAMYTYWSLLNDEARHAFGRPVRASRTIGG
jgi:hypothetical protein